MPANTSPNVSQDEGERENAEKFVAAQDAILEEPQEVQEP